MNLKLSSPRRFEISLFGGPLLEISGSPCSLSPHQGGLMGLLYGGPLSHITREEVISLLWPDDAPPVARRRLNQLLYSFKKKTGVPPPFVLEGEEIHRPEHLESGDLGHYLEYLESGRLPQCAELLRLGFLRRLDGQVTRELSDWIRSRDSHFKERLGRRGQAVLAKSLEAGHWSVARGAAEALLTLDPHHEGLLRALMKAIGSSSGFLEAEAAMREFGQAWKMEMGAPWEPSTETHSLLQRLRSGAPMGQAPKETDLEPAEKLTSLVGRETEYSLLRRAMFAPPHRALRGILISGEAGIGKTRLISEALSGIHLEGQSIFWANPSELERLIPLNPFIEAFRGSAAGDVLQSLDEPWRTVMYGVMPHHYRGEGPVPHAPEIQAGSVPRRLFEAVHQLLLELAEREPTILVIEDIQWADETTLAVLEFLIRRWDRGRLQVILSVRSEEIDRKSTLRSFLETLRSHEDHLDLHLGDLDHPSSQELIRSLPGRDLHQDEVSHLQSLAGGNPFFLIELTLEYLAGRVDRPVLPTTSFSIPLSIKQVLRRRLSQLSPESERILSAVSVHTHPISLENLAKVTGIPEEDSIDGLDQLHQFRLIRSEGTRISPAHELIRQTVYQELNPSVRAWIHERVARLLQEGDHPAPPDELAVHFHKAGAAEEALLFAREAAERAEESGAIPEALQFLKIAREHTSAPRDAANILGKMGHLNYLHQNLRTAAPLLETAAKRLRSQGDKSSALRWELEWIDCLGKTGLLPLRECLDEISRIKEEASANDEFETLAMALDTEVHLFDRPDFIEEARTVIREAMEYTKFGSSEARCRAQAVVALNLYFGDPDLGLEAAREAVRIGMQTESQDLQLLALNRLMVVLLYQGRLHAPEGKMVVKAMEDRFGKSGDLLLKFFVKLNQAVWHLEIGELHQARNWFLAAEDVIRGTQATSAVLNLLINRAEFYSSLNEIGKAQEDYREAGTLLSSSSPQHLESVISAGTGICALQEGDLTKARNIERKLGDLPEEWTFDPSVIASFKAEMFRMRGDLRSAAGLLGEIADTVKHRFVTAWLKLTLQRTRYLRRIGKTESVGLAKEGAEMARFLGLSIRQSEFERLLED